MPSVFAGGQAWNGSFRADQLVLLFDGDPVDGFLVQQVQFSFTQQVTMLYEIGSENVYYVGGRSQGTATLAQVIGPAALSIDLINKYNDICVPQPIGFFAAQGCPRTGAAGGIAYTLEDAILVGVSANTTAQEIVINHQLQFMFIDLDSTAADGSVI